MTVFVQRDANQNIIAVFPSSTDQATEGIDRLDPAVVAFISEGTVSTTQRSALLASAIQAVSDIDTYLQVANTATPAQVRQAVQSLAQDMKLVVTYLALQVS
jgi:hypothetical protein